MLKQLVHAAGRRYIRAILDREESRQAHRVNERPVEYRFALQSLGEAAPATVLDVGTGTTAWPSLLRDCGFVVTAIDNVRDYWEGSMINRHWPVKDVDITRPNGFSATFDAVTCISVIEHIEDHRGAFRNMAARLNQGGVLILTTPYSHHNPYPNVYKHPDAIYGADLKYICRSSAAGDLNGWVEAGGLVLERRELWRGFTGALWATGGRAKFELAGEDQPHQLGCFVFRKS